MVPSILITRPQEQAEKFASQVRLRLGSRAHPVISPLMQIVPTGNLPQLAGIKTLVFTSAYAVHAFANLTDGRNFSCFAVGASTADAACEIGLSPVDGGGDSKALIETVIRAKPPQPFLYLRGEHVASDLCKSLNSAGFETLQAIIYQQKPQTLSSEAKGFLLGQAKIIIPLFSPRSAQLLFGQMTDVENAVFVAMSENIKLKIPNAHQKQIFVAKAPTADAVLDLIEDKITDA